jgi:two-component system KDP operon response regulator KdpE
MLRDSLRQHRKVPVHWKANTIADIDNTECNNLPGSHNTGAGYIGYESTPSFLLAVPATRDDKAQGRKSSDAISGDFSVNLLPLGELIARVCVTLKQNKVPDEEGTVFSIGELLLDSSRHLVQKKGRTLHLTPKEFKLLHSLMMNAGRPVPHLRLLRSVWGAQYGCERDYLRIYIRQLRVKIEDNPAKPKYLLTEPYIGYRFADSVGEGSVSSAGE